MKSIMMRESWFLLFAASMLIITDGCRDVRISDNHPPSHASPMTTYSLTNMASGGRPVHRSNTGDWYLYYIAANGTGSPGGKWVVGKTVGAIKGYVVSVRDDHFNAHEITGTFLTREHGTGRWVESAEVTISCTEENVALGKSTSQSSTDGSHTADLAVDGRKGTSVPDNQCTLTNAEEGPWWEVDLGGDQAIRRVGLLNRGDCCGSRLDGFVVLVKQEGHRAWQTCGAQHSGTLTEGQSITVDCGRPIIARYVRIQVPGKSDRLSLCEVEVFTDLGCPAGYIVHGGMCYKPYNTPKTHQDALATCQQDNGTLAMPRHRHTNRFMTDTETLVDILSTYWIGLQKENGGWVWGDGKTLCEFRGWGDGYPSATDNNCTVLGFTGKWQDKSCEATAKFICQVQAPVSLTAVGYQKHREAYFQVFATKKTFDEAVAACGRSGGGRLAQPETKELNDYLKGKIGETSPDEGVWIGIKLATIEEPWSFLDGSQGDASDGNWAPGEPLGKGCVTMTSDGSWKVGSCEEEAYYICQIGDERNCREDPVTAVNCGGSLSGSSGRISSPGYGENVNYPDNLQCHWDITVPGPEDNRIELTFEGFELEQNDRLEINDVCRHGYSLANLTGSVVPSPITTSTNRAAVSFTSDGSYGAKGFNVTYQAVPTSRSRPLRSLDGVQDKQEIARSKRSLIGVAGGIFSGLKEVYNFVNALEGDRRHQEIMNVMADVQEKLDSIDAELQEQGIKNELNDQLQSTATKYSDSVATLDNLLGIMNDLRVGSNGTFQPEEDAQELAETVLKKDSEGMDQILRNMYGLVMGSANVVKTEPIIETMEAIFRHQNLPNAMFRAKLKSTSEFVIDRQAGGYGLWVFALQHTGREDDVDEILRRARSKLSEQMCFLAPFFYDWPAGTYGLPKTTEGCPSGSSVAWEEGQYEHQRGSSFNWQTDTRLHFSGNLSSNNLARGFCLKTTSSSGEQSWPLGRYCVLKKGPCPMGLTWGKLGFPGGTKTGAVPDGSVGSDSIEVEYCCQEDGFASSPIHLPPRRSFYLLRLGGECQQVAGMDVRQEWIEYKGNAHRAGVTPDDGGDDNSHKLYYCFYSVPGSSVNIPTTPIVSAAMPHTANVLNFVTCIIISCAAALWVLL
ncbi:MRC1 [Branchiostoma lanceolatum]|uniref:MRC1 protein n=1 Tax=Branchiostoma lanceolatum TaxID=7740 RepID=A0A8J9V6L3_BRALA|nr:MRC1 [Branchiostoma lanceolatum]